MEGDAVQATFSGVPKTKKGTLHARMSLAQPANDCTNRAGAAHKKKADRSMISTIGGLLHQARDMRP
jgi:hypothetical protein